MLIASFFYRPNYIMRQFLDVPITAFQGHPAVPPYIPPHLACRRALGHPRPVAGHPSLVPRYSPPGQVGLYNPKHYRTLFRKNLKVVS